MFFLWLAMWSLNAYYVMSNYTLDRSPKVLDTTMEQRKIKL